jgi:hypothetical protein
MFSIVLLDKNGNGLHDDFGIDLIALGDCKMNCVKVNK